MLLQVIWTLLPHRIWWLETHLSFIPNFPLTAQCTHKERFYSGMGKKRFIQAAFIKLVDGIFRASHISVKEFVNLP